MKDNQTLTACESASALPQSQTNPFHRILVVEDDVSIRQFNTAILITAGFHVDAAEDGAVAWDTLQLNSYHLMITDNNMPKVSGVELLKKVHGARMSLPVMMATGKFPAEFIRNPWLQPAALLLKPYTHTEFLGTVKEVLRATEGVHKQIASPPNRQSQPSTDASPFK